MQFMWQNIRKVREDRISVDADDHGGAVHRCLHGIMHLIEDHAKNGRHSGPICSMQAGRRGQADPGTAATG